MLISSLFLKIVVCLTFNAAISIPSSQAVLSNVYDFHDTSKIAALIHLEKCCVRLSVT